MGRAARLKPGLDILVNFGNDLYLFEFIIDFVWAKKELSLTTAEMLKAPWLYIGKSITNSPNNRRRNMSPHKKNNLIKEPNQVSKNGNSTS